MPTILRITKFSIQLLFCFNTEVASEWKIPISSYDFWYFIFFVFQVTGYVLMRFLKRKSEIFSVFQSSVTLICWQYSNQVLILHIDFEKFNSNVAAKYFEATRIIWKSSFLYTQKQNKLVELVKRKVIECVGTIMINSQLSIIFCAKILNLKMYIKIYLLSLLTVFTSIITNFKLCEWNCKPKTDQNYIFRVFSFYYLTKLILNQSCPKKLEQDIWLHIKTISVLN